MDSHHSTSPSSTTFYQRAWQVSVKGILGSRNRISKMILLCGGENHSCKLPILVPCINFLMSRSMYWNEVSYKMQHIRNEDARKGSRILRKGSIGKISIRLMIFKTYYKWAALSPSTTQSNISQLDFFDLNYRFIKDSTYEIVHDPTWKQNIKDWNATRQYPNIWLPADALGKSLFSVVLSDLGQNTSSILTDTAALQQYTENFPIIFSSNGMNAIPGPAIESYKTLKGNTGPPPTSSAVISTKYLCQVPRRRAMGTLIMSLILANLVLLRTSWALLTFITSSYVSHVDPVGEWLPKYRNEERQMNLTKLFDVAHHCIGCIKQAVNYSVQNSRQGLLSPAGALENAEPRGGNYSISKEPVTGKLGKTMTVKYHQVFGGEETWVAGSSGYWGKSMEAVENIIKLWYLQIAETLDEVAIREEDMNNEQFWNPICTGEFGLADVHMIDEVANAF